MTRDIPMGRFGQDGDLDGALLLLVSDAGAYMTGATIVVDGGQMVALRGVGGMSWTSHSRPRSKTLRLRTRAFVDEHVLPLEADPANFAEHENIPHDRLDAGARQGAGGRPVGAAVAEGIWRHGIADGRLGGDLRGSRALAVRPARLQLHGAGRRQHERAEAASARRRRRKNGCAPIVDGKVRSSFAMTEPAPGGGSDPTMIRTQRRKAGQQMDVITGRKWFITGADGASHFILWRAPRTTRARASPRSSFTRTSPAGASCAASRSWGRRSMAAIASWNSTASKCRTKTC